MTEIEPCPKCGALPCDWTDNPHTAPSGDEVERVARAIHGAKMEGHNPDCLYEHHEWENWPVDDRREYADPFTGKTRVQLFHKAWRRHESAAQAAIAAMRPARGELADELDYALRSALRFAASRSAITAAEEKAILAALRQAGEG